MDQTDFGALARKSTMSRIEAQSLWEEARHYDGTLAASPALIDRLAAKRLLPVDFSRAQLFNRMERCQPTLFSNFPIRQRKTGRAGAALSLEESIELGFPRAKRARVRTRGTVTYLPIPQVLVKWRAARSVFGVTDLHYISTRFDRIVDTSGLNDFNLLPRGTDGFQSQDSLVISSKGAITDSHSDDHSGSNHSFTGAKIWLLWDTVEGFEHGLEDVEHQNVTGERAAFDLSAFARLASACWILIGPGQTMFIPARLTHKVITLEKYVGLGSFHAGLPGFVDLLMRWQQLRPLWLSGPGGDKRGTVEFLTRRAIRKIHQLRKAGRSEQLHWGLPNLKSRIRSPDVAAVLKKSGPDRNLQAFVAAAQLA